AYPRDYKHRFLNLIAGELQQDRRQRAYFDEWGSRAYVLLPGIPVNTYDRRPDPARTLDLLELDDAALRDLGVRWILSAFPIRDARALQILHEEGFFTDPRAAFPIHLYRVLGVSGDRRGD